MTDRTLQNLQKESQSILSRIVRQSSGQYVPINPIIFKENYAPLIQSKKSPFYFTSQVVCGGLSLLSLKKSIFSLIKLRFFRACLWAVSFGYFSNLLSGLTYNRRFFVNDISLCKCGTKVRLSLGNKTRKEIDIKTIRKLFPSEQKFFYSLTGFHLKIFFPIVIDDRVFLIKRNANVINKEVFTQVLKGNYITIKEKLIKKESVINV